jgi:hypothetical protein
MDSDVRANGAGGPSRRDLLRKGAIVGAAAVWAVPVVQVISMTPAHAETASTPTYHQQVPPPHDITPPQNNPQPTPLANPAPPDGSLSYTGAPVITTLAASAAALATGTGIVLAAKKRRRATEDD